MDHKAIAVKLLTDQASTIRLVTDILGDLTPELQPKISDVLLRTSKICAHKAAMFAAMQMLNIGTVEAAQYSIDLGIVADEINNITSL